MIKQLPSKITPHVRHIAHTRGHEIVVVIAPLLIDFKTVVFCGSIGLLVALYVTEIYLGVPPD